MQFDLHVDNHGVFGVGADQVGGFTLRGTVNHQTNIMQFTKQYHGKHAVQYYGRIQKSPQNWTVNGHWQIPGSCNGPFQLIKIVSGGHHTGFGVNNHMQQHGGFGGQQGGFGQPPNPGFGGQPGGFGQPPNPGFGGQPGGFGNQPGGFGQPPNPGFGGQPGGFGGQPGFGQPGFNGQQQGGFGGQPGFQGQQGGFGQPPHPGQGGFGGQQGGFGGRPF